MMDKLNHSRGIVKLHKRICKLQRSMRLQGDPENLITIHENGKYNFLGNLKLDIKSFTSVNHEARNHRYL